MQTLLHHETRRPRGKPGRGVSVALLFSLVSTAWLVAMVGQGAISSRRAAASLLPLVGQSEAFEREILQARIHFVYYATINRPGALDSGWAHFGAAHVSLTSMERSLPQIPFADPLRPRLNAVEVALDLYQQRLESMLATVANGSRTGPRYEAEVAGWAAAGDRLVAAGQDLQDGSRAFLAAEVHTTGSLLRLSLLVLGANGVLWLAVACVLLADSRPAFAPEDAGAFRLRRWFFGRFDRALALYRRHALDWRTSGGWAVMALAALALVATGVSAIHSISVLISEQGWAIRSQGVLTDTQAFSAQVYQAESATRAFLLNGNANHHAAQQEAMHEARDTWSRLFAETTDDPAQQARLRGVLALLNVRFATLLRIDDAFQAGGLDQVRVLVAQGGGARAKAALEAGIRGFDSAEHQRLIERSLSARNQATLAKALIGFVALPAALGLGGLCMLTTESLRRNTELREQMSHLAHHDPLTGLPNRLQLKLRSDELLARAQRLGGVFAVLGIDLDHFKEVNDRWGHETGDQFLQAVAARMNATLRSSDTLIRTGGDEFLCLLDRLRTPGDAALVAEKLLSALREPVALAGVRLEPSASIGLATYPADGSDCEELQRQADAALYAAKAAGRGCVRTTADVIQNTPATHEAPLGVQASFSSI